MSHSTFYYQQPLSYGNGYTTSGYYGYYPNYPNYAYPGYYGQYGYYAAPQSIGPNYTNTTSATVDSPIKERAAQAASTSFNHLHTVPESPYNIEGSLKPWKQIVNFTKSNFFDRFLNPNEGGVVNITSHLAKKVNGLVVTVGTERFFFDALLCPQERFQGIVNVDCNEKVKAYVDFNILLLRISPDRSTYSRLTDRSQLPRNVDGDGIGTVKETSALRSRIKEIHTLLLQDIRMPKEMKTYYETHLEDFAHVYFSTSGEWSSNFYRKKEFSGVQYHESDKQFTLLQKYAQSGMMCSFTGDINQLEFLGEVGAIDLSNIPDYIVLNIQVKGRPTIIWTQFSHTKGTLYYSLPELPSNDLNPEELEEFNKTLEVIKLSNTLGEKYHEKTYWLGFLRRFLSGDSHDENDMRIPLTYSKTDLRALADFKEKYCFFTSSMGWVGFFAKEIHVNFQRVWDVNKWSKNPNLLKELIETPGIEKIFEFLVVMMYRIDSKVLLAFFALPDWRAYVIEKFKSNPLHPSISDFRKLEELAKK